MTRPHLCLFPLVFLSLCGCSGSAAPDRRRLKSGGQVTILSVTDTETESGYRTLHVAYSTALPPEDYVGLFPEVQEVWSLFLAEAELGQYDAMMVRPQAGGFADPRNTYPFTRRGGEGWETPQVLRLQSGSHVLVVGTHAGDAALFVDYVSALPIRNLCGIVAETDEVFAEFEETATRSGVGRVFISPHDAPTGSLVALAYSRDESGEWFRRTAQHCKE